MHMQCSTSQAPSQEPVFLTRIGGELVVARQPACRSELPLAGGESVPAEAWSTRGSTAPKRRRRVPVRRACRSKRERMGAYVEEVAAQLRADPFADISQVNVPEVIFNTPYLQKHSFTAVRELLKGCGRSILDADFLSPALFTAGRRRGSIAGSSHASQCPMVPYDPMMTL